MSGIRKTTTLNNALRRQFAIVCALFLFVFARIYFPESAIAEQRGQSAEYENLEDKIPDSPQAEALLIDGVSEIKSQDGSGNRRSIRKQPVNIKGSICGQGDDCSLRPSEDVILSVRIPTSGYWSFSLCGSSFDTYMAVGYSPCTADIGSNDDFCGTSSMIGCVWVQQDTVYVTIEAESGNCGKFIFSAKPCIPGRCCYMDTENTAACLNTTVEECASVGGEWDRQATCENNPCEVGRCCYREDGISNCTENTLRKPCLFNLDGVWTEGATCDQPCEFGEDSSLCGPLDLVIAIDVSGSMGEELSIVSDEAEDILLHAAQVSGADLRASLVTFREFIEVQSPLSNDLEAVAAAFTDLFADGGANPGEASDEALREIVTQDGGCVQGAGFTVDFREHASKVVILITDELNSACNQIYDPAYAHQRALDAAAAGIHISSVYIENGLDRPGISSVLRDYATTSGGLYVVSEDGHDIAIQLNRIIEDCGQLGLAIVDDSVETVVCAEGEAIPSQAEFSVLVSNLSDQLTLSGVVIVGTGSGTGGTGVVISDNPLTTGDIAPQDTVAVPFTAAINPTISGGCINFPVYLMRGEDTLSVREVCVNIPPTGAVLTAYTVPQITCDGDSLAPTTFELSVTVHNLSGCAVNDAQVRLSNGAGSGGTGTVLSTNPISVGSIPGNGNVEVPFTVTIVPNLAGGLINFTARLILEGDTVSARIVTVTIPPIGVDLSGHTVPQLTCMGDTLTPRAFEISVAVRNTSDCDINEAQVFLWNASGTGGTGIVLSTNPLPVGPLPPGGVLDVPFTVMINPRGAGGAIIYRAKLIVGQDTVSARNIPLTVPAIGALLSSSMVPQVTCVDDSLTPTAFDVSLTVQNPTDCEINGARIYLSNGTGSGGTGDVLSANPLVVGTVPAGQIVQVPFTVAIDPRSGGGQIVYRASLMFNQDTLAVRNITLTLPPCGCDSIDHLTINVNPNYWDECLCIAMCDTTPLPLRLCFAGSTPGRAPIPYFTGQCGDDCVAGSATISGICWQRHGNCWDNSIRMTNPGCVRICFDFILPVDLESFNAVPAYGGINLVWRTQSETELDKFELLRDGVLMEIVQAENSPAGAVYEWLDVAVSAGRVYEYQLIAVDMAGMKATLATSSATPLTQPTMVSEYALLPNYPNPFNGSTSIDFDLPENADITLVVYDVNGREVAELARGHYSAGRHHVVFSGEGLASGLYLCHMTAPGFSTRQKMLLLK